MRINFVVFHAGDEASCMKYRPLMRAGRDALQATNPSASYIVLTDRETAPYLEKDFSLAVLAPSGLPLMRQYIAAQMLYERQTRKGLTILAAADCAANRDFSTALQPGHKMAITYRPRGNSRINNVAYIEDHDLAAWFLKRAYEMVRPDQEDWFGDQQAWEDALGPFSEWELLNPNGDEDFPRVVKTDMGHIYLYRCRTHNFFNKNMNWGSGMRGAYIIHFKGQAKERMVDMVQQHIVKPRQWPYVR